MRSERCALHESSFSSPPEIKIFSLPASTVLQTIDTLFVDQKQRDPHFFREAYDPNLLDTSAYNIGQSIKKGAPVSMAFLLATVSSQAGGTPADSSGESIRVTLEVLIFLPL